MWIRICVHVNEIKMIQQVAAGMPFEPNYIYAPSLMMGYKLHGKDAYSLNMKINELLDAIAALIGDNSFMAHTV